MSGLGSGMRGLGGYTMHEDHGRSSSWCRKRDIKWTYGHASDVRDVLVLWGKEKEFIQGPQSDAQTL